MKSDKILYIQYMNPASYPPLEHSSRILADRGWKVLFLGLDSFTVNSLRLPDHPNISMRRLPNAPPGWRQRLQYLRFCFWIVLQAAAWRPVWVYASDTHSCFPALLLKKIFHAKILYHEHDSPAPDSEHDSLFLKMIWRARKSMARQADICVLPNENRIKRFLSATGRTGRVICVWNCPETREVRFTPKIKDKIMLYYHGNANPEYIPMTLLEAMKRLPDRLCLKITAFEVMGHKGYLGRFQEAADRMGLAHRLDIQPPKSRLPLLDSAAACHVGLSFTAKLSGEINNFYRVGASNKPFDYMACGMALLVSDIEEWSEMYVRGGYGLDCDPMSLDSLEKAMKWFLENPEEMKKMGEGGRKKIIEEWNYENQFMNVLELLEK